MLRVTGIAAVAALAAALWGCQEKPATTGAAPPPTTVVVSTPLVRDVTDALEYTGRTDARAASDVRPRVTGFIETVHFAPRDVVREGDVLFSIDAREFTDARDRAAAQVAAQAATLAKAEFDAKKVTDLYGRGVSSEQEYTEAVTTRDAAAGNLAAAKAALAEAQLDLDWCSVRAPISGRVGRDLYGRGDLVLANQTVLARVVDDTRIFAYFNVAERDVLRLRAQSRGRAAEGGAAASAPNLRELNWPAQLALMNEKDFPHRGVLDYVAPELDSSTGTLETRAVFDNPSGLISRGMFVRIRVPLAPLPGAVLVTERALGSDQGQRYVFVVGDKDVVARRSVEVGPLQDGLRVITAGLTPEERVIVDGLQRVRPGVTVKPVAAPMPVGPAARATSAPASRPASH